MRFGHTRPHARSQPKFGLWPSLWPNVWPKNKNTVLLVSYADPFPAPVYGDATSACCAGTVASGVAADGVALIGSEPRRREAGPVVMPPPIYSR